MECTNCGTERSGEYCSGCGQRFLEGRLTLRGLWREGVRQLFNVERGLLRTVREMLTDPGGVARRYTTGHRRRYLNPFTYLLLGSAAGVLIYRFTDRFSDLEAEDMIRGSENMSPEAVAFMARILVWFQDNSAWSSLLVCVPFALLLRLFFRRSGSNLAEIFVLSLFALGQVALLTSMIYLPRILLPDAYYGYGTIATLNLLLVLLVTTHAVLGFFGKSFINAVKSCFALALSYFGYIGFMVIVIVALMLRNPVYLEGTRLEQTLFSAAIENDLETAAALLAQGADVRQTRSETPLHLAAARGHLEMVELLIDHGADLEALDHRGNSALLLAVEQKRRDVAVALIERGADVHRARDDGTTSLMLAASRSTRLIKALLEAGAEVDAVRDHRLATALMVAADGRNTKRLQALLDGGADPSKVNAGGETALEVAGANASESDDPMTRLRARALVEILRAAPAPSSPAPSSPVPSSPAPSSPAP